ncbi:MAG: hypothetical protein K1X65_14795 [Caldilineales bacterium]|nr:hypothetical protein [Caldilineales bacterium]
MDWLKRAFSSGPALPPSDSPPQLASELIEAEAIAAELVDYLLSDRLFWQLSVETPLGSQQPKMTLGGLWERMKHLEAAAELGPNDRQRLAAVNTAWEDARRRYPPQFSDKLKRELESYLKNWRYFLDQFARDPERWREEYEVELRNRRRVELVLRLLGPDAPAGILDDLAELEAEVSRQVDK